MFHPFYVFQIASLILWSLDEYYFYAAAIFVMSVGSITMTLIETRSVSVSWPPMWRGNSAGVADSRRP